VNRKDLLGLEELTADEIGQILDAVAGLFWVRYRVVKEFVTVA